MTHSFDVELFSFLVGVLLAFKAYLVLARAKPFCHASDICLYVPEQASLSSLGDIPHQTGTPTHKLPTMWQPSTSAEWVRVVHPSNGTRSLKAPSRPATGRINITSHMPAVATKANSFHPDGTFAPGEGASQLQFNDRKPGLDILHSI